MECDRRVRQDHASARAGGSRSQNQVPFQRPGQLANDIQAGTAAGLIHANAIVRYGAAPPTAIPRHVDAHDAVAPSGKCVFARVENKLGDDEAKSSASVGGQPALMRKHLAADVSRAEDRLG
jgi:hypothetical protein